MTPTNVNVRIEMTRYGLKQWQVAALLGMSESVFCRRLKKELPEDEQQAIIEKIKAAQA